MRASFYVFGALYTIARLIVQYLLEPSVIGVNSLELVTSIVFLLTLIHLTFEVLGEVKGDREKFKVEDNYVKRQFWVLFIAFISKAGYSLI